MTPRKKIFFDLDGTVIDSRRRLYDLFCHLAADSTLGFDAYWTCKRAMMDHGTLLREQLGWEDAAIDAFQRVWMGEIEKPEWLQKDTAFAGVHDLLATLRETCDLYLITARQSEAEAVAQLRNLGIFDFFSAVFVTEHKVEKHELLQQARFAIDKEDIVVGDTGMDVRLAQELGCTSVAVESGFRSREVLERYQPDYIVASITDPKFLDLCLR